MTTRRPSLQNRSPEHLPMVSHPESADRPRAPRAPASVASSGHSHSHSHHRRHRYGGSGGRSHHGGSTHQPMNEFPVFAASGDVEIVIWASNQERRYLLHRLILAQCSGFFEAGTSDEWSRGQTQREEGLNSPTSQGGGNDQPLLSIEEDGAGEEQRLTWRRGSSASTPTKTRWRYELDWENREEDEMPILVQKPPSASGSVFGGSLQAPQPPSARTKPPPPQQGFFRSMTMLSGIQSALHLPSTTTPDEPAVDPTIRDYDNLFRIFYNYPPNLNSVNIASAYSECKSLLSLADMYDALGVTGPRVDHHLLRFSSRLYKQIAKYPPSYLKLGYLARSRVIFSEALIHVVGQWPAALPHVGPNAFSPLPDIVLDLIEDKVDDLEDMKARIEAKLFRLTLTTSRGERVSPSNAYLDWLAVSLFRQWLVENTTPPPPSILKPLPAQPGSRGNNNSSTNNATATNNNSSTAQRQASTSTAGAGASNSNSNSSNASPRTQQQPFSSGRAYRLLGSASNQAYLTREELKKFLKLSADSLYTRDNLKRFERKMDEIKRLARDIVKPLMRNFLELDVRVGGGSAGGETDVRGQAEGVGSLVPYLTCTRVEDEDLPWD